MPVAPRQGRRFGDEILDQLDLRGEPVAALGPARSDAEQRRDRVAARAVQSLPRDGLADEPRIKPEIARIGGRVAVDIGVDLEIGAEVGIALEEGRVPERRADKDHLYIKRYRPRLRRAGERRALRAAELFDADHAIAQRAFEERPALGIGGDRFGAQHQHAAIGAMQRAGADLQEIGMERALALAIFDPAEEMLIAGIGLDDHRRMHFLAMIDEEIDGVAPLGEFAFGRAAGLELKSLRRFGDVDAHRGEPATSPSKAAKSCVSASSNGLTTSAAMPRLSSWICTASWPRALTARSCTRVSAVAISRSVAWSSGGRAGRPGG